MRSKRTMFLIVTAGLLFCSFVFIILYLYEGKNKEHFAEMELREIESCKPHEVVVFIKTHKTGSSTMANILNRFADINDLKVALPTGKLNRFRWPIPFHLSAVDVSRLDGDNPSILVSHARYHRTTFELIMRKGAKYITILRNPVDQYESTFNYMEFGRRLQLQGKSKYPLEDFMKNPVKILHKMRNHEKHRQIPDAIALVKNPMFFDLGMHPPAYDNMTEVKKEIMKMDRELELVLIMEYFDESLILLKKALCWTLKDILYLKFNQRKTGKTKVELSHAVKQNILRWNKADMMLYDHYNRSLWKKIHDYGPSFWKDVKEFRELNSKMQSSCVEKKQFHQKASGSKTAVQIITYHMNPNVSIHDRDICVKMLRNGTDYISYFRKKFKPHTSYKEHTNINQYVKKLMERL